MIAKLFTRVARAATVCLLIAVGTAGSQLMLAPSAYAQMVPNLPGAPPTSGPQMPGLDDPSKAAAPDKDMVVDEEKRITTSPVFEFLKQQKENVTGFFKGEGGQSYLPIMLTPLRIGLILVILIYYVAFHFKRQERMRLEAEEEAQANEPKVPILPEEE